MNRVYLTASALLASAMFSLPLFAQGAPAGTPSGMVTVVMRQGTPVNLTTLEALSSKTTKTGDRFQLTVSEDVKVNGVTVIPAGISGVGEVTNVEKKGMFGKSGKIDARVLYVRMGENTISLTGAANDAGKGGTAGVVAAAVLLWPLAPFITGTSASLPSGTRMTGWVATDQTMIAASAPRAIMVTPPPTTVPATPGS